jgi:hypothetical protein
VNVVLAVIELVVLDVVAIAVWLFDVLMVTVTNVAATDVAVWLLVVLMVVVNNVAVVVIATEP